jgi:hypothetical protein
MTISMNFVLVFEEGKKNPANFEHYDLRDDNELDPNIRVVTATDGQTRPSRPIRFLSVR